MDGDGGFIVPAARKRLAVIAALPPAGRAAYRLFYDSEAKKLLDEAEGANELKNLERVYSAYFASSVGDNAADRLGDLYFELGRFDSAAGCWLSVVRDRPDSELAPALLTLKAALALEHAGRRAELQQVRAELEGRYSDEKVTLGGATASGSELLRRHDRLPTSTPRPNESLSDRGKLDLSTPVKPLWQVRFAQSIEAGMVPAELQQWESHPLSVAVPAAAVGREALFVNELGFVFAVDLTSGKLRWRSESLHHLKLQSMQDYTKVIDATRFAIVAAGSYVCSVGRNLKEPNMTAPHTLTCRRVEGGEIVWQSSDIWPTSTSSI